MEQIVPDARAPTLHEGTTGVRALDLLGRKVLIMSKGKVVWQFIKPIAQFALEWLKKEPQMRSRALSLLKIVAQWSYLTLRIALMARSTLQLDSAHFAFD